jgi:hypothetical protein
MPIHAPTLLTDLKRWVTRFEDDLRQQCKDVPTLDARLKAQYKQAKDAGRTAFAYAVWRDGELTQSAVGWVLSCVFVRFLEDNDLLERSFLSGVGENRGVADETRAAYFRENRAASDNDYLGHVMSEIGKLPGMADLMDARHNALWNASISPDAAKAFIEFWRRIDPGTGKMAHEFTDPEWDTRFLGDLYQDLSESARKKFALLQTPDFVEEFILDRTLDPAINTFGLKVVRMIDPTCGSGHFLLGGFRRLLALWEKARPDLSDKERAVKALDGVYGVDINPFAVAIARFRLLLAAWRYCGVKRLRSAPDFKVNLSVGDSLLHGARFDAEGKPYTIDRESLFGGELVFKDETAHHFEAEDAKELHRILGQQYQAVVGNPPYITVKDKALNDLYRKRYDACYRTYSLSVPFMERFFDLALSGSADGREPAGFTGQITSNSFMKAEFGKKLIEEQIPRWDLTHVIDVCGAFIPGHNGHAGGTPTVIVFGRNTKPTTNTIRAVMGIKGEPSTPDDPAKGKVWCAITDQLDRPGSESEFVSVVDSNRDKFHNHPWSLQGGGVASVMAAIERGSVQRLNDVIDSPIGRAVRIAEEEIYMFTPSRLKYSGCPISEFRGFLQGEFVRDWQATFDWFVWYPYAETSSSSKMLHHFWQWRTPLRGRSTFQGDMSDAGLNWYDYMQHTKSAYATPLSITFAFVATHNHFVLDRGGNVFKQTAPVIKLLADATEDDHLKLLGLLNSSVAWLWGKQNFFERGGYAEGKWQERVNVNGTPLSNLPLPSLFPLHLARELDRVAGKLGVFSPDNLSACDTISAATFAKAEQSAADIRGHMISLQEELDWQCYRHYGLIDADDNLEWPEDRLDALPPLTLGERAFEIGMARQMADGELETTWFERHKDAGSKPITELPAHWPDDYRALVERRLVFIGANKNLNLIERPEYKRRWNTEPWAKRQQAALEKWLLTRLETYFHDADRMVSGEDEAATAAKLAHIRPLRARFAGGGEPRLVSVRQLAQTAQADSQWMEAATVFAGRADFDVAKLVEALVLAESVPALPDQRYKPAGLRKREEWEKTWELQRAEDAVEEEVRREVEGLKVESQRSEEEMKKKIRKAQLEAVGDIPVPPKYGSGDFLKSSYWKLRGKLDVPKERWVVYPGMEGGHDTSPVIAWAGWDHAQQAAALTGFYQQAKDTWGWAPERLAPLLAALKELLPWLQQWHNAIDPEFGDRISTTYQQFYDTERHTLRFTDEEIEAVRMGGCA